jgi:hypothetical protein
MDRSGVLMDNASVTNRLALLACFALALTACPPTPAKVPQGPPPEYEEPSATPTPTPTPTSTATPDGGP